MWGVRGYGERPGGGWLQSATGVVALPKWELSRVFYLHQQGKPHSLSAVPEYEEIAKGEDKRKFLRRLCKSIECQSSKCNGGADV